MDPDLQENGGQAAMSQGLNSNVPLPPRFVIGNDLASQWKKWKQIWDSFEIVTGLGNKSAEYRTATFITCIGEDALDIYNGLPFAEAADKTNIDTVIELFGNYCVGETNVIFERNVFNNRQQEHGETFDNFVSSLRTLAQSCDYGSLKEDLIRDRIVNGIYDKTFQKTLLQDRNLTLKSAIERGRAHEAADKQCKAMNNDASVHAVHHKRNCHYCGERHRKGKNKCPAYGHTCEKCSKKHHYESECKSVHHSVRAIGEESDSSGYEYVD